MIPVSSKCVKDCNSDSLKYKEFIVIDGQEIDIKGKLSATAYKDTTFFGTFNMKMLTFETDNDVDYKNKEFDYYKQVNDEIFKIGRFITTEVKDSDTYESVNVTAYDYALKFANKFETRLNYSSNIVKMLDMVNEICQNVGIELENKNLPNGNFIVDTNQFVSDEQFGDVISIIALENGMFATINQNNKLEFIFKKETRIDDLLTELGDNILTESADYLVVEHREARMQEYDTIEDYIELNDKRDTRPITCVLVAPSEDLASAGAVRKDYDLIQEYGENWLKIYDYAFAYSSQKCEELIDNIFDRVKGFGYSSFETDYSFKPYLQLGDEILFKNKNGELVKSLVLRIETDYDNVKLSAPSIINASVEYKQPETAEQTAKNAYVEVNRATSQIVLKADKNGRIVQAELNADASDGTQFNIKADNINLEGYTSINNGFAIDIDGNAEMKNAKVNGGRIELDDLGDESYYNFLIYNSNNSTRTLNKVNIGDVLSGKTLQLSFPEESREFMFSRNETLITTTNGKIEYVRVSATETYEEIYITKNNDSSYHKTLFLNLGWIQEINLTSFTLPKDFGTVTSISTSTATGYINPYNYIKFEKLNAKKYFGTNSNGIAIYDENNNINSNYGSNGFDITDNYGSKYFNNHGILWQTNYGANYAEFEANDDVMIYYKNQSIRLQVDENGCSSTAFNNISLESTKKNFEKFENALELVENTDVYKYNYKNETDNHKKHIGLVIPDEGGNYKTPVELTNQNDNAIDIYSMVSICLQAIKEQQKIINELKEEIKSLKESDK